MSCARTITASIPPKGCSGANGTCRGHSNRHYGIGDCWLVTVDHTLCRDDSGAAKPDRAAVHQYDLFRRHDERGRCVLERLVRDLSGGSTCEARYKIATGNLDTLLFILPNNSVLPFPGSRPARTSLQSQARRALLVPPSPTHSPPTARVLALRRRCYVKTATTSRARTAIRPLATLVRNAPLKRTVSRPSHRPCPAHSHGASRTASPRSVRRQKTTPM